MKEIPDVRAAPSVKHVQIRNYKSIAECGVTLDPLTVLVGPNAAGKSNFLDALRFVSDALTTSPGQALSKRGGLNRVLHHKLETEHHASSFTIGITLSTPADGSGEGGQTASYRLHISHTDQEFREQPWAIREERCDTKSNESREMRFSRTAGDTGDSGTLWSESTGTRTSTTFTEIPSDRLFLPFLATAHKPFRALEAALTSMCFYEFDTDKLRDIDDDTGRHSQLGPDGQHIGHVLGLMAESTPEAKESVDSYLRTVIPNALGVDEQREGDSSSVQARFWTGEPGLPYWEAVNSGAVRAGDPHVEVFRRQALSEGTLRAAGVLTATFQPGVMSGKVPLVAVEEPEKAIHPSTVGALFEALHDASSRTQVVVTTQSSDFLDSESMDPSYLRIVEMRQGATVIGEMDEATQRYLREHPSQLPEMHRQRQFRLAEDTENPESTEGER